VHRDFSLTLYNTIQEQYPFLFQLNIFSGCGRKEKEELLVSTPLTVGLAHNNQTRQKGGRIVRKFRSKTYYIKEEDRL
jgi:hypothetical protein